MAKNDPGTGAGVDASKVEQVLQTETGGRALTGPAAVIGVLVVVPALDCITPAVHSEFRNIQFHRSALNPSGVCGVSCILGIPDDQRGACQQGAHI